MSPETERNLERAMAFEAFATAKYTRFAACARRNENPDLASLFQATADLDRIAHFRKEFDFVYAPCDDAENLQSAISDKDSVIEMYSEFMRQAQAAGDYSAAALFDSVRRDEMVEIRGFKKALDEIRSESLQEQAVGA
jgi:rubrerythrin